MTLDSYYSLNSAFSLWGKVKIKSLASHSIYNNGQNTVKLVFKIIIFTAIIINIFN